MSVYIDIAILVVITRCLCLNHIPRYNNNIIVVWLLRKLLATKGVLSSGQKESPQSLINLYINFNISMAFPPQHKRDLLSLHTSYSFFLIARLIFFKIQLRIDTGDARPLW